MVKNIRQLLLSIAVIAGTLAAQPQTVTNTIPAVLGEAVFCTPGATCPTQVSVATAGGTFKALSFPAGKTTCTIVRDVAPHGLDTTLPFNFRLTWFPVGGGSGSSAGGVCSGQCARVYVSAVAILDGVGEQNPAYGPETASDYMPPGGPNAKAVKMKFTSTSRGVSLGSAKERNPEQFRVCRRTDTYTGAVTVREFVTVWNEPPAYNTAAVNQTPQQIRVGDYCSAPGKHATTSFEDGRYSVICVKQNHDQIWSKLENWLPRVEPPPS